MSVEILGKVRKVTGLKNYSIHKRLLELGYDITLQGLDGYDKPTARSMRLDILAGLEDICCGDHKLPRSQFWAWLDEFRGKRKKKEAKK